MLKERTILGNVLLLMQLLFSTFYSLSSALLFRFRSYSIYWPTLFGFVFIIFILISIIILISINWNQQIKRLSKKHSIHVLIEEFTQENMSSYTLADSRSQLDAAAADELRIKANVEVRIA